MLEERLHTSDLFDLYGALLTEKQQRCLEMHLFEDFSLSEIGEAMGISRQAVYDTIHRAEQAMEGYDARMGLVARYQAERAELKDVCAAIRGLADVHNKAAIQEILGRLSPFLGRGREV